MSKLKTKLVTTIAAMALLAVGAFGLHSVGGVAKAEDAATVGTVTHADCFGGDSTHGDATELPSAGGTLTSGKYYLNDDVTLDSKITVANNAEVSICLNGRVLRAAASSRVIEMNSGATLNLYDCNSENHTHYYVKGENGVYDFNDELTAETADGSVTGGVVTGGDFERAGALYVRGTFIMYGGTVAGNKATVTNGGGFFADSGSKSYLRGGAFCGNFAQNRGGGFYVTAGAYCEMNDGVSVTYNSVKVGGGGIFVNGTVFDMNGGTVAYNSAPNGGGIWFDGGSTFNFNGGLIEHNQASSSGGGMYSNGGKLVMEMNGGTVKGNIAESGFGGGLFVNSGDADIAINNGTFEKNQAISGGGIGVNSGTVKFTDGKILNNEASSNGGGVYVNGGTFEMSGGTIGGETVAGEESVANKATNGGGVAVNSGKFELRGGNIVNNEANTAGGVQINNSGTFELYSGAVNGNKTLTGHGGGIFVNNGGTASIFGGTVNGNTAKRGGGGIFITAGGDAAMSNSAEIANNYASEHGGGVYVHQGASLVMNDGTIKNNTTDQNGGGVFVHVETVQGQGFFGSFTMNGGSISGNTATSGGGVYINADSVVSGLFAMSGGAVKNNNAVARIAYNDDGEAYVVNAYGGGVYVNGTIELSGNVEISGNKRYAQPPQNPAELDPTKAVDGNIYLNIDKIVMVVGVLTNTERIGVASAEQAKGAFTSGYTSSGNARVPVACFAPDDKTYLITKSSDDEDYEAALTPCEHDGTTNELSTDNATCEADGAIHYSCSYCGKTWDITLQKTGHSFTDYVSDNNATCTTNGTETAHCDNDGCTETDVRELPNTATGHNYGDYVSDNNATCTANGTETAHCGNTGCTETDVREEQSSAKGHSYGDYVVTKQPTYDAEGEEQSVCAECGDAVTRLVPAKSKPADKPASWLWLYILITIIIIALFILLVILIVRRKRRKK